MPENQRVPGLTTFLTTEQGPRQRRLCEFPGFDYSQCEKGTQSLLVLEHKLSLVAQERDELREKYDTANKEIRALNASLHEKDQQQKRILKTELDRVQREHEEKNKRLIATAKAYRDAGRAIGNSLLEFGNHTKDCNYWSLMASGRIVDIPEQEVCNCGWVEDRESLLAAKNSSESRSLTQKEIDDLLDLYAAP